MRILTRILILCIFFSFAQPHTDGRGEETDQFPGIQGSAELRAAYDPDLIPVNMLEDGEPGFAIELMDIISENAGINVTYIPMTKAESVEAIKAGEIDVIISIPFSEKHAELMEFTDSYFSTSIGILTRDNEDDINVMTDLSESLVALQNETLEYEFLKNIRRIQYQVASSQKKAFELFLQGRADAFVGNLMTAQALMESYGVEESYSFADSYLLPVEYSFAVQSENYSLVNILNREIRRLKASGVYSELYEKHFQQGTDQFGRWLLLSVQVAAGLLLIFLIIFFIGIRWNRQLQKEVSRKTSDLNELNRSLIQQVELKRNNNEFLNQILDSSPRGIVTLDRQGYVTKFNPQAMTIAGVSSPPLHMHFERLNLINVLLKEKAERVLAGGNIRFLGEEKEWTREDGRSYLLRYFVYPLYTYDQGVAGLILTFEDVTEEYALKKKLFEQEKNQALSRVVAGIAHEVRNPLSSIKTFVELIPKKINNEKFQKEISTYVPKEIVRVNQLIEGLINYARPRHQKFEEVDVKKLLEECVILFERTANNKGFGLSMDVNERLRVIADPQQLKQVVINLIINGLDAMEEKDGKTDGTMVLKLYAKKHGDNVMIEVTDEGVGMGTEELQKVMEPFYTTKAKGTGLGLAIAGQIVQENNGELTINSRKNKGTTVRLLFPASLERSKKGDDTA